MVRVALAGLAALAVAMGIGRFAFTPILPMMQHDTGLSVVAGGWLASANYLGYLLGALSATVRIRRATAIRTGLVMIVAVTLAMAGPATFVTWLALRALAGIASAWVLVNTSSWCLELLASARRPVLTGVVFAGVGSGIAVAGAVCLVLMERQASAAEAWTALGLVALAGTAAVWRTLDTGDSPHARTRKHVAEEPRRDRRGLRLVVAYGFFGFGYIVPATFLPVMARQIVGDSSSFGWAWPAFGAAAAVTPLAGAACARRLGSRRVWIGGQMIMAAGVAAPVLWPSLGGILFAALLVGGTFMVVTMAGMQQARVVAEKAATPLMAVMTSAFGAGQIVGPIVATSGLGGDGSMSPALLLACALLLVGAALLAAPARR